MKAQKEQEKSHLAARVHRRGFVVAIGAFLGLGLSFKGKILTKILGDLRLTSLDPQRFTEVSASLLGVAPSALQPDRIVPILKAFSREFKVGSQFYVSFRSLQASVSNLGETPLEHINQLPEKDRALAQRITQVWYTGIFDGEHEAPRRLNYDSSWMFSAFNSIRPAPGSCFGIFGYWTETPFSRIKSQEIISESEST